MGLRGNEEIVISPWQGCQKNLWPQNLYANLFKLKSDLVIKRGRQKRIQG